MILQDLLERRDAATSDLETLTKLVEAEQRDLTGEEETRSAELLKDVDEIDERIDEETRKAKRADLIAEARRRIAPAATDVAVTDEPMVYGPGASQSFYIDHAFRALSAWGQNDHGASERLSLWSHQVETEIAQRSKKGLKAENEVREAAREMGPERGRAAVEEVRSRGRVAMELKGEMRTGIATGGGATASASGGGGAAFVSPAIMIDDYAPYRQFGRGFADACGKRTLPDYGMEVYIPQVTGQAGIGQQTEGVAVTETDPTAGYLSGAVITNAGEVILTQQLLDRAGPNFSFDRMIFDQLNRAYAPVFDTYVLNQVLGVCAVQQWTGSSNTFILSVTSGSGGFYGQLSKAKAAIRTTNGTVLNPTHLFLQPARWEYIAAWSDSQGRPIVVPDYAGPFNALAAGSSDGDEGIEGNTGYRMNGLRAFTDANIPVDGTASYDQAIVGDLEEVYVYEGPHVTRVIPQTYAQNLQVLLQLYAYATVITRYPKGVVSITGTGMSTISYTT